MQNETEAFPLSLDETEVFPLIDNDAAAFDHQPAASSWDMPEPDVAEPAWGSSVWSRPTAVVEPAIASVPWAVSTPTAASASEWNSIDDAARWSTPTNDSPAPTWPSSASWDAPETASAGWAPMASDGEPTSIARTPQAESTSWPASNTAVALTHTSQHLAEPQELVEPQDIAEPHDLFVPRDPAAPQELTELQQQGPVASSAIWGDIPPPPPPLFATAPANVLDAGIPFHQLAASHAASVGDLASPPLLSPEPAPTPNTFALFNAATMNDSGSDLAPMAPHIEAANDPIVIVTPTVASLPTSVKAGRFAKLRAERAKPATPELAPQAANGVANGNANGMDVGSVTETNLAPPTPITDSQEHRLAFAAAATPDDEAVGVPTSGRHAKKKTPKAAKAGKAAKAIGAPSTFFAKKTDDEVLLDEAYPASSSNVLRVAAAVSLAAGIGLFGYTVVRGKSSTPTPPAVATSVPTVATAPASVVAPIAAPIVPAVPVVSAPVASPLPGAVDSADDIFASAEPASPSTTPTIASTAATAPTAANGDDLSFSTGGNFSG